MNQFQSTRQLLRGASRLTSRSLGSLNRTFPSRLPTKLSLETRYSKFHSLSRQFSKPTIPIEPICVPIPDISKTSESKPYEKEEGQRQVFSNSAPDDKPNEGNDPHDANSRTRGRRTRKIKDKKASGEYTPSIPSDFVQLRYKSLDKNESDFSTLLYPLSETVKQEMILAIQAALIPSPQDSSAQGRRSNILLECSAPGASTYLDGLVECSAKELGADVLSFDIHDLMVMTNDIFSRTNVNPWPIFPSNSSMMSSFPGSPYVSSDSYGQDDDEDDDMDDEDDGWQDNGKPGVLVMGQGEPFGSIGEAYKQKLEEKFDRFFTSLLSTPANVAGESRPLIVHFKDFSHLGNSRFSVIVLKSLMEVAQKERQKGRRIVVVGGVTPSLLNPIPDAKNQLVQDISSVVMQLVERASYIPNFYQISIPTPEVPKALGDAESGKDDHKWKQEHQSDRERSIHEINIKNIISLCIRKGASLNYYDYQNFGENLWDLDGIRQEVWSFEKVHRLTTVAIGRASIDQQDAEVSNVQLELSHFQQALQVVNTNLGLRPDSLTGRLQKESEVNDPFRKNISKEDCNSYEKRMLSCVVDAQSITSGFSDICTNSSTIQTLQTLITLPLLRPHLFARGVLARHYISGLLLFGPPGTGKTLLAKAVAKESGSNVLEIKGSDVYNKYVGEGEKNVKAIFSLARKLSPCVVFIDEVDALFSSRRSDSNGSGKREIINQFMVEWDGLTSKNSGVIIMAATNRPFDLDDAVLRRMPRRILVDLPQQKEREQILKLHLREETLDPSVDISKIAQQTSLYSGSDLKNVCISAALNAVKDSIAKEISAKHSIDPSKPLDLSLLSKSDFSEEIQRPLSQADFDNALLQVAPSCSDEMQSVLELRKWDKTYGDGAKARNKKASYGFGMADIPLVAAQQN